MKNKAGYHKRLKRKRRAKSPAETLAPFLKHLNKFDTIKTALLKGHFYKRNLSALQSILDQPFAKNWSFGHDNEVLNLKNPTLIKDWLYEEVGYQYKLDIRYQNHFPSYLLVKTIKDYWLEVLFIEDILYVSPDYPIIDDRIIPLRIWGNEKSAIRLDRFKGKISKGQLKLLGLILTAAWRQKEDFLVYYFFPKTSSFRQLVELTSLVKNTQTAALRDIAKESISFFEPGGCYPQKALFDWFNFLNNAVGNEIDEKEKEIRMINYKVKRAWKDLFLKISVELSKNHPEQPVWKWCYANYWRLNTGQLKEDILPHKAVQQGMQQLDQIAEKQMETLFTMCFSSFSAIS